MENLLISRVVDSKPYSYEETDIAPAGHVGLVEL